MSAKRSDSDVSGIRRKPQCLILDILPFRIRPRFRKEFWKERPYIDDGIFILNSTFHSWIQGIAHFLK
jgi:hypothetical protein